MTPPTPRFDFSVSARRRALFGVAMSAALFLSIFALSGCVIAVPAMIVFGKHPPSTVDDGLSADGRPAVLLQRAGTLGDNKSFNFFQVNDRSPFYPTTTVPYDVIRLPVGWNALSFAIEDSVVEGWDVKLMEPGTYVLKGDVKNRSVLVWIEDRASGKRMTEELSVVLVSRED